MYRFKLQDYLNGEFGSEQQVSLKEMFECRVDDVKSQYKSVSATRLMLKRLGFDYSIDNSGKCMVKLPHVRLEKKLTLILRCLTTFESKQNNLLYYSIQNLNNIFLFLFFKVLVQVWFESCSRWVEKHTEKSCLFWW